MTETVIEIENLSKAYRLGELGFGSLREAISRWRTRSRKGARPSPALAPEQAGPAPNTFWALRDVTFSVGRGEVVGVIGRNGAGKSTLLKILSRITEPTSGRGLITGRVGSLLEVGAGFHPELSGRDNIFLNGAILGMRRADIRRQLDQIIEFSDVGAFIDTPVKRYSSGMYVRLAFAVAAHLEPEILIVDEVLAVGDASFQRKCLGRMRDMSRTHARTVLFASHNLEAVQRLCGRSVLLDRGRLRACGDTATVVAQYLGAETPFAAAGKWIDVAGAAREGTGEVRVVEVRFTSGDARAAGQLYADGPAEFELAIEAVGARRVQSIALGIRDPVGQKLVNVDLAALGETFTLPEGRSVVRVRIEELHLKPGTYTVALWIARYAGDRLGPGDVLDFVERAMEVEVVDLAAPGFRTWLGGGAGVVTCDFELIEISHPGALPDRLRSPR